MSSSSTATAMPSPRVARRSAPSAGGGSCSRKPPVSLVSPTESCPSKYTTCSKMPASWSTTPAYERAFARTRRAGKARGAMDPSGASRPSRARWAGSTGPSGGPARGEIAVGALPTRAPKRRSSAPDSTTFSSLIWLLHPHRFETLPERCLDALADHPVRRAAAGPDPRPDRHRAVLAHDLEEGLHAGRSVRQVGGLQLEAGRTLDLPRDIAKPGVDGALLQRGAHRFALGKLPGRGLRERVARVDGLAHRPRVVGDDRHARVRALLHDLGGL